MINDLEAVHPDVERDTQWLALCLSGSSTPPPGDIIDMVSESNGRVLDAHEATPWKRVIREYLILKVESLPGHMSSYKGKRTKMSVEAVDHAGCILFKQVHAQCFQQTTGSVAQTVLYHGGSRRVDSLWIVELVDMSFPATE